MRLYPHTKTFGVGIYLRESVKYGKIKYMNIKSQVESLLFLSPKPMTVKRLTEVSGAKKDEVSKALAELKGEYASRAGGTSLIEHQGSYQMTTSAENAEMVRNFLKEEQLGELTKPGLETLTIVAYRGPLTKAELEQIRGVNCSLILRNLMIRGLVDRREDKQRMQTVYEATHDFLRYIGVTNVKELPDYEKLSTHESLERLLEEAEKRSMKQSQESTTPVPQQ